VTLIISLQDHHHILLYGTVQYPSRYMHTLNIGVLNMTRGVRPKDPKQSHVLYTKCTITCTIQYCNTSPSVNSLSSDHLKKASCTAPELCGRRYTYSAPSHQLGQSHALNPPTRRRISWVPRPGADISALTNVISPSQVAVVTWHSTVVGPPSPSPLVYSGFQPPLSQ
jgi:hypothetical protein